MPDLDRAIRELAAAWDEQTARGVIREVMKAAWQTGKPDAQGLERTDALRRIVAARLAAAKDPAERLGDLNASYDLEQGIGRRQDALGVARQAEQLARKSPARDRVLAAFQLAKAFLYVDRTAESVKWSLEGLRLGAELERSGGADREVLRLLADQESRLAVRAMSLGRKEEVDRAVESAQARWEKLGDPVGMAAALGLLCEARQFQGRWEEAAALARRSLEAAGYPEKTDGAAYALWNGAMALGRLGDFETAIRWTHDSARINMDAGNPEGAIEARITRACVLCLSGEPRKALDEIETAGREVAAVHMGVLAGWVAAERAWIRMRLDLPVGPEELAAVPAPELGPARAGALYLLAQVLDRNGRDGRKEREEAIALFRQHGMKWHLEKALGNEPML